MILLLKCHVHGAFDRLSHLLCAFAERELGSDRQINAFRKRTRSARGQEEPYPTLLAPRLPEILPQLQSPPGLESWGMSLLEKHGHLLFKTSLDFQSLAPTFTFSQTRQLFIKRLLRTARTRCRVVMAGEGWAPAPPSQSSPSRPLLVVTVCLLG